MSEIVEGLVRHKPLFSPMIVRREKRYFLNVPSLNPGDPVLSFELTAIQVAGLIQNGCWVLYSGVSPSEASNDAGDTG